MVLFLVTYLSYSFATVCYLAGERAELARHGHASSMRTSAAMCAGRSSGSRPCCVMKPNASARRRRSRMASARSKRPASWYRCAAACSSASLSPPGPRILRVRATARGHGRRAPDRGRRRLQQWRPARPGGLRQALVVIIGRPHLTPPVCHHHAGLTLTMDASSWGAGRARRCTTASVSAGMEYRAGGQARSSASSRSWSAGASRNACSTSSYAVCEVCRVRVGVRKTHFLHSACAAG